MALISTIRRHNWILIVAIGVALAAFIMMDMFSGEKSVFGGQQTTMGNIDGTKLDYNEFMRVENALYPNAGGDMYARRNSLWDYFVEEAIVKKEAEGLGLNVGRDEMMDLQYGANLSPIMQQRFRDPNTGQVNRDQLNQIKQLIETNGVSDAIQAGQLAPSFPYYWSHQMREVEKDRLQSKLGALVQKSVFIPTWMAEMTHVAQSQKVDFSYVKIPFDEINGGDFQPSDSDLQNYLNDNKVKYINDEEIRKLAYITYNIVPTKKDSSVIYTNVANLVSEFRDTDKDSTFVDNHYGTISGAYFAKDKVSNVYADTIFNAPIGSVVGPYLDGKRYTIVKLLDRKIIPDSVHSRHILIGAKTDVEYQQAFQKIDSLKNLIDAGTNSFEELAIAFSTGPSGPKGGDLGFAGLNRMVQPFNDLIFYSAEKGKVYPVVTQFGVHLVEVLEYKFINNEQGVKFASVSETIVPSQETQKVAYNEALDFIANNSNLEEVTKAANENSNLTLEVSPALKANDFFVGTLGSGQASRDMVKWAFNNASLGDRSDDVYEYQDPVDYYDNKYVIACLSNVQKAGSVSLANVKEEIEPLVSNLKKGEFLKGKIGSQPLEAIAGSYNSVVDTVNAASFNSSYLPEIGSEPKVIAAACNMEPNAVSAPIVGTNGIYVIKLLNKAAPTAASNIPSLRKQASGVYQGQVNRQLLQAMRKTASIQDNRSTFY